MSTPRTLRTLTRLPHDAGGSVLIELAFVLPVLIFLTLAGVEMGRYVLLNQKLESTATTIANLAARDKELSEDQLDDIFTAGNELVSPFHFAASGRVIVSSVSAETDDDPEVYWQRTGPGSITVASEIGATGGAATIPAELPIRANETIIVAEVFYEFTPLFDVILEPRSTYHVAFLRPRLGSLQTLQ